MKTLFLPNSLRPELRKIWGIAVFGRKTKISKKFKQIIQKKKFTKVITVGDYCSLTLTSNIKIFDGKVKRKKIKIPLEWGSNCLKVTNPSGTIQEKVWPKIRKAIKEEKFVFVNGEEDLLVIPTVLLAKKYNAVVYGFPKRGVCLIEVSLAIKKIFKKLLKKFSTKPN